MLAVDRPPHLAYPVAGVVSLINVPDTGHERLVPTGPGRWLTLLVSVIRAHSNPCSSPFQGTHDWLDSKLVFVLINEGDDHFDGRSSSAAKKAEARRRISLALLASANSARSLRFSVSKSIDSAGVLRPEWRATTRGFVLTHPHPQGLFVDTKLSCHTTDRAGGGCRIGLGMNN